MTSSILTYPCALVAVTVRLLQMLHSHNFCNVAMPMLGILQTTLPGATGSTWEAIFPINHVTHDNVNCTLLRFMVVVVLQKSFTLQCNDWSTFIFCVLFLKPIFSTAS